jgi:malonate decarboxylase beta subunit
MALWQRLGVADAQRIPDIDVAAMHALRGATEAQR